MAITAGAVAVQEQVDAEVEAITDAQVRALVAAWVLAWSEVSADLRDTLTDIMAGATSVTRATMFRSQRLRAALDEIGTRLAGLAEQAGVIITADLEAVTTLGADTQRDILAAQLPEDPLTPLLLNRPRTSDDDTALAAIVRRSTQEITSRLRPVPEDTLDTIRAELIRGVAVGSNPRATAARMVDRAEERFNFGLTRAMNIARTETLDAHRAAGQARQDQLAEVLQGWVWLCHFGPRTCRGCLARHGTIHDLSVPGPYDHPQGRCTRMAKVKPWADLGFEVEEPEDDLPDARAWFDALDDAEQTRILGAEVLAMLRAGDITWDDLAVKKTSSTWRESWHPTPAKRLRALAQSRRGRRAS